MARIEMRATELTGTDVNFVSLVKRGANRIPFRITKGDEDMDLYAIGRRIFQKSDPVPTVVAVIAQKSDEKTSARLHDIARTVGFEKVALGKADDGVATLTKADADVKGATIVKLDDKFAIAIQHSNLARAMKNHDFSESIFKDVNGAKGFFVGTAAATRMFNAVSTDLMKSAASPAEAAVQLGKAADDYRAYMDALAIGLPANAMSADQLVKDYGDEDDWNDEDADTGAGDGEDKSGEGDEDNRAKKQDDLLKADAGLNGTGEGFDKGKGTGADPRASEDDAKNTEINAKPGEKTSGSNSGMPESTMKAELIKQAADLLLKALTVDTTTKEPKGESQAGKGAAQAVDHRDVVSDEGIVTPGTGKVKGKTLDMDGVPAGVRAKKNDGDATAGKTLPDDESGAGAQQKDVQTFKAEDVMRAVSALAKSVEASNAAVTKKFDELAAKVESVGSLARKTDAALNGTVFNDAGEDRTVTRKSENGVAEIPLLDTAYSRRTA